MAFIRSYSEQGDPRLSTLMRAGFRRQAAALPIKFPRGGARPTPFPILRPGLAAAFERRGRMPVLQGDPFFGGIGKFFKKAAKAVKKFQPGKFIAKAAPIAATVLTGGVGGLAMTGLSALANRLSRPAPEAEVLLQPEPTGPPSQVVTEQRAAESPDWDAFFSTLSQKQLRDLAAVLGVNE